MVELRYPDPVLADEVVRLRPWTEADLPAAHAAVQDPLVERFTRVPPKQTLEDLRIFLASHESVRADGVELRLAIADVESDAFLGAIGLLRFDWANTRGEIGYWLAPEARGRGCTTRAVRLLSRWALTELGLGRLGLHTDPENKASQRVAVRCGYTREGILRSYDERLGDRCDRCDRVIFSLLPEDLA